MATQINSNLAAWSTTAASNQPDGSDAPDIDADFRQIQAVVRKYTRNKGSDMASAATLDLSTADGDYLDVTGTTGITGLGTVAAGMRFILQFDDAVTLTHSASLVLPGAANLTATAGDHLIFESLGAGNWRCILYMPANGYLNSPTVTTPNFKGEEEMQTAAGNTYLTFPNNNTISANADIIGADNNIGISSKSSVHVFLDSDNNGTTGKFKVWANGAGTGTATEVFSVDETGILNTSYIETTTSILANGSLGFGSSASGTVTQLTDKSTAVTLNKPSGYIVTHAENLAAGSVASFTWNNSYFSSGDEVVVMNVDDGVNGTYMTNIEMGGVGACTVQIRNVSSVDRAEALKLRFAVIKVIV